MEKTTHIAEKWPTGCGTLFYPLVRPRPVSSTLVRSFVHFLAWRGARGQIYEFNNCPCPSAVWSSTLPSPASSVLSFLHFPLTLTALLNCTLYANEKMLYIVILHQNWRRSKPDAFWVSNLLDHSVHNRPFHVVHSPQTAEMSCSP